MHLMCPASACLTCAARPTVRRQSVAQAMSCVAYSPVHAVDQGVTLRVSCAVCHAVRPQDDGPSGPGRGRQQDIGPSGAGRAEQPKEEEILGLGTAGYDLLPEDDMVRGNTPTLACCLHAYSTETHATACASALKCGKHPATGRHAYYDRWHAYLH